MTNLTAGEPDAARRNPSACSASIETDLADAIPLLDAAGARRLPDGVDAPLGPYGRCGIGAAPTAPPHPLALVAAVPTCRCIGLVPKIEEPRTRPCPGLRSRSKLPTSRKLGNDGHQANGADLALPMREIKYRRVMNRPSYCVDHAR